MQIAAWLCSVSLVFLGTVAPLSAHAMTVKAGETASIPASTTVNDDQYLMGGTVTAAGSFMRDLVAAGGTLIVSGAATGDLMLAGGTVTVTGDVGDDLRAAGGTLVLIGGIEGDLVAAGGQVSVGGTGIGGDVAIVGGEVTIDAPVAGNVTIHADKVVLGEHAAIAGDLSYTASNEATVAGSATVAGHTTYKKSEAVRGARVAGAAGIAALVGVATLVKLVITLVGALALAYFFRRFAVATVAVAATRVWVEIGRGLVVMIVLPVASIILLVTLIGLSVGALGLIAFAALMLVTSLMAPVVLGAFVHKRIWKSPEHVVDWRTIVLGTFLYFAIGLIPVIGWVVNLAIFLLTLGAIATVKWQAIKEWR